MLTIIRPAQAGTIESSDIMITVAPGKRGSGVIVELTSPVLKKFGNRIRAVIVETVQECGMQDAFIQANDRGALDCTIRARVKTALMRAELSEEV